MRSIRQAITDGVQPRVIEAMIGIGNVEELRDTDDDQTVLMYAIEKRAAPAIICMLAQNMDAGSLSKTSLRSRTALMMAYRQADLATILALTEPRGRDPYAASAGEESDGEVSTDESEYDEVRERFAADERQNRGDVVPSESARDSLLRPYRPAETEVPPAYTPRQHEGELLPSLT